MVQVRAFLVGWLVGGCWWEWATACRVRVTGDALTVLHTVVSDWRCA